MPITRIIALLIASSLICACNDSNSTQETSDAQAQLQSVTSAELNDFVRRALTTGLDSNMEENYGAPVSDTVNNSPVSGGNGNYSSTTLQEAGVDEADIIKTDGQRVYSIDNSAVYEQGVSRVRFLNLSSDGSVLTEDNSVVIGEASQSFSSLYLDQSNHQLVALQTPQSGIWDNWFSPAMFREQSTGVVFIDTDTAVIDHQLKFEGSLISSRRINNRLFMILRHYPSIDDLILYPSTTAEEGQNSTVLASLTTDDFLPKVTSNTTGTTNAVSADNCYVDSQSARRTSDIITLISLNLDDASHSFESLCYVGSSEAIYASTNALYLATTHWDYNWFAPEDSYDSETTTNIHKFAFTDTGFDYRGSGEVEGHLGNRQSTKSFRFGEQDDVLKVFTVNEQRPWLVDFAEPAALDTSNRELAENTSPVMLTLLKESQTEKALKQVSQLPNTNRPAPIGKDGEQLYATRFMGERAFAITFRVTDPLYLIDTSNTLDPYIAGELEIDGYSEYLQPLSDSLLLGIGKDALPDGNERGAWYQGVKLSLIDISDPANPSEVDRKIIGKRGTESVVLNNHHALSYLTTGDITKVALPITLRNRVDNIEYASNPWYHHGYTHTGLYRYEIDLIGKSILDSSPEPLLVSEWPDEEAYGVDRDDRSVLINDTVHYLHNGDFWTQDWSGESASTGPQ